MRYRGRPPVRHDDVTYIYIPLADGTEARGTLKLHTNAKGGSFYRVAFQIAGDPETMFVWVPAGRVERTQRSRSFNAKATRRQILDAGATYALTEQEQP